MNIAVIGTGYVGLVTGVCFASVGNNVICVENNVEKLQKLKEGISPIFEPFLEEYMKRNIKEGRLHFLSDIGSAIKDSSICFITVGTPEGADGSPNLSYVLNVAHEIGKFLNGYKVIVDKSTVPVGTAEKISEIIRRHTVQPFDVISNPEFLRQGSAMEDFMHPDRVIIGSDSSKARDILLELYSKFVSKNKIIQMSIKSAELTKYAANSFLATKISFINEIANLCEKVGADVEQVRLGLSTDNRIGNKFLFPGLGFGGSCFPKDLKALIKMGDEYNCDMSIIKATNFVNTRQRYNFLSKIFERFGTNLKGKTFAVWGLAFKPKTDDIREAPAITIVESLLKAGANIKVYDPKANDKAAQVLPKEVVFTNNPYDVFNEADAMLLMTEWEEFKYPDFEKIRNLMSSPIIFDGRNLYNMKYLKEKSFECYQVGR